MLLLLNLTVAHFIITKLYHTSDNYHETTSDNYHETTSDNYHETTLKKR